jgi:hypothetical protein
MCKNLLSLPGKSDHGIYNLHAPGDFPVDKLSCQATLRKGAWGELGRKPGFQKAADPAKRDNVAIISNELKGIVISDSIFTSLQAPFSKLSASCSDTFHRQNLLQQRRHCGDLGLEPRLLRYRIMRS